MDRLRRTDERHPFVLNIAQIAELDRRASRCDHPLARLAVVATRIPAAAHVLTAAPVRGFDRRNDTLALTAPNGRPTRVSLGRAAATAVRKAIAGRTAGSLFQDANRAPIVPDADAVEYLDEMLAGDGEGPLPFAWSFRRLREGVFAGMADSGVRQDVAEAQAGLRHLTDGHLSETCMRVLERATSDWWATQIGVPTTATSDAVQMRLDRETRRDDANGDPTIRGARSWR